MGIDSLEPEFVEFIPHDLVEGTLYISMVYATTVHLCPSGCGNKVVLPLSPAEWHLEYDGETVSLSPSVGNWDYPCRSHYWIRHNTIKWAGSWTDRQIEAGRKRDQRDIDDHFQRRTVQTHTSLEDTMWRRTWRRIGAWMSR